MRQPQLKRFLPTAWLAGAEGRVSWPRPPLCSVVRGKEAVRSRSGIIKPFTQRTLSVLVLSSTLKFSHPPSTTYFTPASDNMVAFHALATAALLPLLATAAPAPVGAADASADTANPSGDDRQLVAVSAAHSPVGVPLMALGHADEAAGLTYSSPRLTHSAASGTTTAASKEPATSLPHTNQRGRHRWLMQLTNHNQPAGSSATTRATRTRRSSTRRRSCASPAPRSMAPLVSRLVLHRGELHPDTVTDLRLYGLAVCLQTSSRCRAG